MCGIAGILRPPGRPGPGADELAPALRALRHRGPDAKGTAVRPGLALGCRRLAVIDREGGGQPMESPDGRFTLVMNGEIHDYLEHATRLRARGTALSSRSDTEVLLRLLEADGLAALPSLSGMFAFALADQREGTLTLARDPFGVKPLLFTREESGEVRFASEGGALAALSGRRRRLDLGALAERMAFQVPLSDRTLVEGVRSLPPGSALTLDREGRGRVRPWAREEAAPDDGRPAAKIEEELRAELDRAGRIALRSDRPLGVTLSGGLDSSLVAGLAVRHGGGDVTAYTGFFDAGPGYDEREHARRAAAELGIRLVAVPVGADDLLGRIRELATALEGPIAGPGSLPALVVAERAARDVTVLLGGQGADEVFGGYARHRIAALEREGRLDPDRLPGDLAAYEPLVRHLLAAGRGDPLADRFFRLVFRGEGLPGLLGPKALEAWWEYDPRAAFRVAFARGPEEPFRRMVDYERRTLLPALLHVEDRVTMARSVESRVPLLDPRIVRLAARIPSRVAFAGKELKHVLRRAARGLAPPSALARRDKMGFPVPLPALLAGPAGEEVVARLESGPLVPSGILAPGAPRRLVDDAGGHGRHLWFFLLLSEWMEAGSVTVP